MLVGQRLAPAGPAPSTQARAEPVVPFLFQRVARVSVTTMDDAPWKPVDGTAFASQAGEGPGVTSPWKRSALTARTTKEVCWCARTVLARRHLPRRNADERACSSS